MEEIAQQSEANSAGDTQNESSEEESTETEATAGDAPEGGEEGETQPNP